MSAGADPPRLRLAVLMVCHNRREKTLGSLRALASSLAHPFDVHVVLLDDGSSDGTAETVRSNFPETTILTANGAAYWNRGLHIAWNRALELGADAYLWLNDDVLLDEDALQRLGSAWNEVAARQRDERFILVGSTRGSDGALTYGGQSRIKSAFAFRLRLAEPAAGLVRVDTFNGNIVVVPRAVADEIGTNDPAFHHNLGDIDYGLRATKAGIGVSLMPGTLGRCDANLAKRRLGYGSPSLSVGEQWRKVNTHYGLPFRNWWRFTRRHSGIWFPLHFLLPYRRLIGIR